MIRARAAITMIAHSVTQIAKDTRFRCMFGQIKRGKVFCTTQKPPERGSPSPARKRDPLAELSFPAQPCDACRPPAVTRSPLAANYQTGFIFQPLRDVGEALLRVGFKDTEVPLKKLRLGLGAVRLRFSPTNATPSDTPIRHRRANHSTPFDTSFGATYRPIATSTPRRPLSSTIFFSEPERFSSSRNSLT